LARSLANHAGIVTQERPREAMASYDEAIRLLAPFLSELPNAYAPLIQPIVVGYLQAAQATNVDPDMMLLAPIIPILEKLNPSHHA
jgi:hypothetical protein